jgi:hypothetical protein
LPEEEKLGRYPYPRPKISGTKRSSGNYLRNRDALESRKKRGTFPPRSKGSVLVDAFFPQELDIDFKGEVGAYTSKEIGLKVLFLQRGLKIGHSGTDEKGRN